MGLTKTDFALFENIAAIVAADLRTETRAETELGDRYFISASDLGGGVLMTNGLFANLLADVVNRIAVNTNLVSDQSYLSTATATHTVPAASGGEPIKITWLDGTIMTLTSSSNISVTTDAKVTDTTWVFENFIQTLTLVDTGTEWEIK